MSLIDDVKMAFSRNIKDPLFSQGLKMILSRYMEKYGTIMECSINTTGKSIDLSVLLKGETYPVTVTINQYEIREQNGKSYFVVTKASSSKPWLSVLLDVWITGKSILEIPADYKWIIGKLV